ncbi:MAG: rod shape-determining protein MreC [Clostridiales bacterium]|nr:rod shape-determining protein MreC [Clostridiales bacterium]
MNFFDRHKAACFAALCLICLALAAVSANRFAPTLFEKTIGFVITPVQGAIGSVGDWFSERISAVANTNALIEENEALKAEIEELKLDNSRIELLEKDNKNLNGLLDLKEKYSAYETTGARIIAKDPGNWYDVFLIDKGEADGVTKNMVVISDGGLVGRIKEAGRNYAQVVSIIDDADAVSAMSLRTGDTGYVKGDLSNKGMCKMELIDSSSKIAEGDEILTSHFSSVYPEGITIGKVVSVQNAAETSTKTAVIEPTADFKHLDSVLIITESFTGAEEETAAEIAETTEAAETVTGESSETEELN